MSIYCFDKCFLHFRFIKLFVKTISCANQQNLYTSLANRYKYLTTPINVTNKFNMVCVYKHF